MTKGVGTGQGAITAGSPPSLIVTALPTVTVVATPPLPFPPSPPGLSRRSMRCHGETGCRGRTSQGRPRWAEPVDHPLPPRQFRQSFAAGLTLLYRLRMEDRT